MILVKDLIEELKKFDSNLPIVLEISNKSTIISKLIDKLEMSSITNPTDFSNKDVVVIKGK